MKAKLLSFFFWNLSNIFAKLLKLYVGILKEFIINCFLKSSKKIIPMQVFIQFFKFNTKYNLITLKEIIDKYKLIMSINS